MNEQDRNANNQLVLAKVETLLQPAGFTLGRDGILFRQRPLVMEVILLNLQGYSPYYLVSLGIRVLNDTGRNLGLNGPSTYWFTPADQPDAKPTKFGFTTSARSQQKCAEKVLQYYLEVAEPWFAAWRDPAKLLSDPETPLGEREIERLNLALSGQTEEERVHYSRSLMV